MKTRRLFYILGALVLSLAVLMGVRYVMHDGVLQGHINFDAEITEVSIGDKDNAFSQLTVIRDDPNGGIHLHA